MCKAYMGIKGGNGELRGLLSERKASQKEETFVLKNELSVLQMAKDGEGMVMWE